MDGLPREVVSSVIGSFLQMRDIKSLRSVSGKLRGQLSSTNCKVFYNLQNYICAYSGCCNRGFIYTTIDPFVLYEPVERYNLPTLVTFVVGICLFPLYSVPFCRILFHLLRGIDARALDSAVSSYCHVADWTVGLTKVRLLDSFCTCSDTMGRRSDFRSQDCVHIWRRASCTENGGCVHCILATTRLVVHCSWMSSLPYSFYVYSGLYITFVGILLMPVVLVSFCVIFFIFAC